MPTPVTDAVKETWLNRPLAIVGMACRLPGADGLDEFWELLTSGGYAVTRMPDSKLNRELYYHPEKGNRGTTYSDVGGFVQERELDWDILPIDRDSAEDWDECHLNLCEVAARACIHAGYDPHDLAIRNTGVFVGHSGGSTLGGELAFHSLAADYADLVREVAQGTAPGIASEVARELQRQLQEGRPHRRDGKPHVEASFAAGLISSALGLNGPFMSIDAACASSLVALALGANALRSGQADMAIVGGASYNKTDSLILFSNAQSCSATASRPFDENADGLISSEGYVCVVIKTLERALTDGDRIQAVIQGIGVSSDGRGRSLWAPRKEGQYTAIERAYSDRVRPDSVQLIEAHATSTQVGDATEMEALAAFYQSHLPDGRRLPVGSVKSNIGHTLETAGLAGLVKSVLAIQRQTIPMTVNVEQLSSSIPWNKIPLYAATQNEPWPSLPAGVPRRAAVNAFGIGGLNVHVVVDEYSPTTFSDASLSQNHDSRARIQPGRIEADKRDVEERVVVVGRGVVVPGAFSIAEFQRLLERPMSQLRMPPRNRVRTPGEHLVECGFITDFQYDWRKHKVPPKQIAQANPLQFMLLDAAGQALEEAGLQQREWDRAHTAVVVGSSFGGDFGNALFGGLRLPEIRWRLQTILAAQGLNDSDIQSWIKDYEEKFLSIYPAVLDETGSFTSSTLASRLTKTFDLMGGAMAIDAGDVSGLAALSTACGLLRGGSISHVLCAAAQRALDHSAMQNLWQLGRLPGSNSSARDGYSVGEGAALVVLKLERDAVRDGDRILATIDDVSAGFDKQRIGHGFELASTDLGNVHPPAALIGAVGHSVLDGQVQSALESWDLPLSKSKNLQATGHLQATQGIVDLVATSVQTPKGQSEIVLGHSTAGQCYMASVGVGQNAIHETPMKSRDVVETSVTQPSVHSISSVRNLHHNQATSNQLNSGAASNNSALNKLASKSAFSATAESMQASAQSMTTHNERIAMADESASVYRFEASSQEELSKRLLNAKSRDAVTTVHTKQWRAAIVCEANALGTKAKRLASQLGVESASSPLAEQGMFWQKPSDASSGKVAWLFPGQGSQYTGMLRGLVANDSAAKRALERANEALLSMRQPTFEHLAWREDNALGEDVWHTQASVLIANWILAESLRSRGFAPSLVAGHSYGEFSALLAAGCWDLENALKATWHRCRSIVENGQPGCTMLSIHAEARIVRDLLETSGLPLAISHHNAPEQTVVGGKQTAIAVLAEIIEDRGLQSRILPVPTAFHTPSLSEAVEPFVESLDAIDLNPPSVPFLSSVTNTYVADPAEIRRNLGRQLVEPLDFTSAVRRMRIDGVEVFVEVGPQQILSRLVRQIDNRAMVVPTNHAKRCPAFQLLCAETMLELQGDSATTMPGVTEKRQSMRHQIVHFDATESRRKRLRQNPRSATLAIRESKQVNSTAKPVHFDATDIRRDARRQQSLQPPESALASASNREFTPPADPAPAPVTEANEQSNQQGTVASGSQSESSRVAIESFLIDFVVEQTGYPAEIIELDWDIEADLGIDSIKKAQLFGELREFFDFESYRDLNLDTFKTLRSIVELLERTPGKGDWLRQRVEGESSSSETFTVEPQSTSTENGDGQSHSPTTSTPVSSAAEASETLMKGQYREAELTGFLVDFVVEQTGYPPEIVELDADLEADLGIDSIKKAQLLGEIREMFDLQVQLDQQRQKGTQDEFRTLRAILDFLVAHLPQEPVSTKEVQSSLSLVSDADKCSEVASSITKSSVTSTGTGDTANEVLGASVSEAFDLKPIEEKTFREVGREHFASAFVHPDARQLVGNEIFVQQARQNLRAYAARRDFERPESFASANGHRDWYAGWVEHVARAVGAIPKSVENLDQALLNCKMWSVCKSASSTSDLGSQTPDAITWIAELKLPDWLTALGYAPLAWISDKSLGRLVVPGSATSFAIAGEQTLLVAGIRNGNQSVAHDAIALSRFLSENAVSGQTELATNLKSFNKTVHSDWWLIFVDGQSGDMIKAESDDSCLALERSSIYSGRHYSSSTGDDLEQEQVCARIGWDRDNSKIVVWTRQGTLLNMPVRLSLDSDWFRKSRSVNVSASSASVDETQSLNTSAVNTVTSRYELKLVPAMSSVVRSRVTKDPEFFGRAVVVGDNAVANELQRRLNDQGVETVQLVATEDASSLAQRFTELTKDGPVPHIFITTPLDEEARISLDESQWCLRRQTGLMSNFWLCQRWLAHVVDSQLTDSASLVAVTSLGGDFGISGNIVSAEGGGLAGLLKSMIIESWTQGYRPLTIKIIDSSVEQIPSEIVDNIWQELRIPTYDTEVTYRDGQRNVIRAFATPVKASKASSRKPKGVWVCTGGARGITAYVAEQLGLRYGLTLHLLGKSPEPAIEATWRDLDEDGLRRLKAQVMTTARDAGKNPVKTWQNTEKAIEIDATLRDLRSKGVEAYYHSCDVADRDAVQTVLHHVRELSGPISGVLHGAGVGKDSRFDRKIPEKVDECIAAKVDGALALMEATQRDPLEYFIGFGSISGRFGANGHTDYSLANEMLCKQIDWFSQQRPEVRAFGFHWHAWGDVGMATKPETRLALEMIDMQFMPAAEGLQHLINELHADSGPSEILITDDRYFRSFYPAETVVGQRDATASGLGLRPLLEREAVPQCGGDRAYATSVDPTSDPFLTEHLLDGRPLLPIVIAAEMLHEAARDALGQEDVVLLDVEATGAVRFFADSPMDLRIETSREKGSDGQVSIELFSDFVSRGGRLIESNRMNFRARGIGESSGRDRKTSSGVQLQHTGATQWSKPVYPEPDSKFFVGWPLQRLRKFKLTDDGIVGRISAPALVELAGSRRQVEGWRVPSAAMDACLFTVGILAWQRVSPGSALPARVGCLRVGRLPEPGEACEVHARLNSYGDGKASFDFTLYGVDGALLLDAQDYEVAWIMSGGSVQQLENDQAGGK